MIYWTDTYVDFIKFFNSNWQSFTGDLTPKIDCTTVYSLEMQHTNIRIIVEQLHSIYLNGITKNWSDC